jgi:hypothetical protein
MRRWQQCSPALPMVKQKGKGSTSEKKPLLI